MKFINREKETSLLEETKSLSSQKLYSISIYGLRRVGKTRLILEFMCDKDIYFFVNKNKTARSLLDEYQETIRKKGILSEYESIGNWEDFFKILFERYTGTIAFDEFQNFLFVDKSVFGTLQKHIDLYENKKNLHLIFTGSTIGLIKSLFTDAKEPLHGRLKRQLHLKPMSFSNTGRMCAALDIKDTREIIKLYSVFGGFPRYYVSIEDENLKAKNFEQILEKFFFAENALFENEVMTILSLEFGKRCGVYYDILASIACGCTRISEIASNLGKKDTDITRQLDELIHRFEIVSVEKQMTGSKKILYINHPLMNFWFRFFYKNLSDYKRRDLRLIEKIKKDFNNYMGIRFEYACREFIAGCSMLPFTYDIMGREWGKIPGKPKGENQYEIDIVALNEATKEILFSECKWKDNADPQKILNELKEKAQYVRWNNGMRKEYFAIFAKSFKEKIKEPRVMLFDLQDMDKLCS